MSKRLGKKRRLGAATVEMAVVTPLLLTMLFGIIEFGYAFTARQALVTAAREGARLAAMPGEASAETDAQIEAAINEYLNPLGLTTHTTTITHSTVDDPTETIEVTIPYEDVSLVGGYFGDTNFDLGAKCSMRKEGLD